MRRVTSAAVRVCGSMHVGCMIGTLVLGMTHSPGALSAEPLVQGQEVLTAPGIGRVALAFIVVAALAVALAAVLKRYSPKFGGRFGSSDKLRVVARISPGGALRLHLLEVESEKVLVAESRNGLALVVLPAHQNQPQPPHS